MIAAGNFAALFWALGAVVVTILCIVHRRSFALWALLINGVAPGLVTVYFFEKFIAAGSAGDIAARIALAETALFWGIIAPATAVVMVVLRGRPDFMRGGAERGKICPRCAETVKTAAQVCRFCGHDFSTKTNDG